MASRDIMGRRTRHTSEERFHLRVFASALVNSSGSVSGFVTRKTNDASRASFNLRIV